VLPDRHPTGAWPRRVLYVDLAPGFGGSIYSLLLLLTHLDRTRWEPMVVLSARSPAGARFEALDVPVWRVRTGVGARRAPTLGQRAAASPVAGRLWRQPWFARAWGLARWGRRLATRLLPEARSLARVMRESGADLVHLNDSLTMSRPGLLAAVWCARPCVCHVRSFDRLGWGDRWLAGRVHRFIYISRALQRAYEEQGIPTGRGEVVYNAVEPRRFEVEVGRDEARRALGIPQDALVVATLGRLVPWKGQDLLLRALARLIDRWPSLVGLIVGGEEIYAPEYPAQLRALARELGIEGYVRFLGHRPDVPRVLAAADVIAHTPVEPEPFGRVVIEAMAARRPVVAADIGALPELVTDGREGLLVPPGDVPRLADALAALLADGEMRRRMGAAGRDRVLRAFTVERYVRGVMGVYDRLMVR